ncbi:MAG TPA: hypothetical protein VEO96_08550 [Thermoplasmata archaeon]|nr:hypothetical protein [Thermoplasmata archaeon]
MELVFPRQWFNDPDDLVVGHYLKFVSGLGVVRARKIIAIDRERSTVTAEGE